jgi:rhomboid protease GluP
MLEFDTQTFRLVGEHELNGFSAAIPISSAGGLWLSGGQPSLAWADPDTLDVRKTYPVCASSAQMIAGTNDGNVRENRMVLALRR